MSGLKRNSKKQVASREKTSCYQERKKIEMKIMRGKKKVKWAKTREGQNMWIEIHDSMKSSDLMTQIPAHRIWCCGSNMQIHTDYRNPVEKKGQHGHSLKRRAPRPLP